MNAVLVDALVKAVLALSPEERTLFQQKLQSEKQTEADFAEQVHLGRKERIEQQDEFLKTLFPSYTPPPGNSEKQPYRYDDPFEPAVAIEDWEALK